MWQSSDAIDLIAQAHFVPSSVSNSHSYTSGSGTTSEDTVDERGGGVANPGGIAQHVNAAVRTEGSLAKNSCRMSASSNSLKGFRPTSNKTPESMAVARISTSRNNWCTQRLCFHLHLPPTQRKVRRSQGTQGACPTQSHRTGPRVSQHFHGGTAQSFATTASAAPAEWYAWAGHQSSEGPTCWIWHGTCHLTCRMHGHGGASGHAPRPALTDHATRRHCSTRPRGQKTPRPIPCSGTQCGTTGGMGIWTRSARARPHAWRIQHNRRARSTRVFPP